MFNYLANPTRFLRFARAIEPWVLWLMLATLAAGLWFALFSSSADYQQGHTVRIMYIHVPSAWMALFCYMVMAASSAVALIWKHPLADVAARATAPIGAAFTFLALVTGSLWGKPMWGTWWVWDARLTSVLVLFFLYLGYMALQNAFDDPSRGARAAAILSLVGAVNVPIIKFSVDWWNSLHQPASILRGDGPTIDGSMLTPLFAMIIAYMALFTWLVLLGMRSMLAQQRVEARGARSPSRPVAPVEEAS